MLRRSIMLFGICTVATLFVACAHAQINFFFTTVHSGDTPSGSPPWATLTMQDIPGGVQITLNHSTTSASGQFISKLNLLFNSVPTSFNTLNDPFVSSINLRNYIDAGLPFNAEIRFKVAPPANRLLPGSSSTFQLFGVSTSDFAGLNTSAMIRMQGLLDGGSSKLIAPEPASMAALGVGLASMVGLRRRKRALR